MLRVIALTHSASKAAFALPSEWLRIAVVSGCALALILAKAPLPF